MFVGSIVVTHDYSWGPSTVAGALPTGLAMCRKKQSLKFGVGAEKHLFKNTFVGARPCHKHSSLIAAECGAALALLSGIGPSLEILDI